MSLTIADLRREIDNDEHRLSMKKITLYIAESVERGADWEVWFAMQEPLRPHANDVADRVQAALPDREER